jgi:hypothetical protein
MTTLIKENPRILYSIAFILIFLVSVKQIFPGATPYMLAASLSYSLMILGVLNRKNTRVHAPVMGTAISIDLLIVLTLEIQRHAVNTALEFSLTPLQQIHIGFSTLATVLYFPIVALGLLRLKGRTGENSAHWHKRLGVAAFIFRTSGFILMFSMLDKTMK